MGNGTRPTAGGPTDASQPASRSERLSMKIISPPQSGRIGNVVYVNSRYGPIARTYVPPRNPQTPSQQNNRASFAFVSRRWRALSDDQRNAWELGAAGRYTINHMGRKVPVSGYAYFMSVNGKCAAKGLPQFDTPPPVPTFNANPVAELAATNTNGVITLKVRVPSQPAQYTLVLGARSVSTGVRCVQHFPFLDFLPDPVDGWSDITALYVARYGRPRVGDVVFIRTCQQIDGWTDVPKQTSVKIPSA